MINLVGFKPEKPRKMRKNVAFFVIKAPQLSRARDTSHLPSSPLGKKSEPLMVLRERRISIICDSLFTTLVVNVV